MTVFDDLFSQMGFPALLELNGEWVTYIPLRGERRRIFVIVNRNPPVPFEPTGALLEEITVSAYNNNRNGISSATVNTGGDKIEVSRRQGREAQRLPVTTLEDDSGGTCVLRLR